MAAEMALDQPPAGGEIGIINGQCPKTVKVFWQDHDGIDSERVIAHRITKCLAQQHDVFGDAQKWTPVVRDNREKERATGSLGSTIVHITRMGAMNGRPSIWTTGKGDGDSIPRFAREGNPGHQDIGFRTSTQST
jgi:hypothetical protein